MQSQLDGSIHMFSQAPVIGPLEHGSCKACNSNWDFSWHGDFDKAVKLLFCKEC